MTRLFKQSTNVFCVSTNAGHVTLRNAVLFHGLGKEVYAPLLMTARRILKKVFWSVRRAYLRLPLSRQMETTVAVETQCISIDISFGLA